MRTCPAETCDETHYRRLRREQKFNNNNNNNNNTYEIILFVRARGIRLPGLGPRTMSSPTSPPGPATDCYDYDNNSNDTNNNDNNDRASVCRPCVRGVRAHRFCSAGGGFSARGIFAGRSGFARGNDTRRFFSSPEPRPGQIIFSLRS